MKNKILVVAAHPDDEVIGCGGTLIRHNNRGDEIFIIFMTNGEGSRKITKIKNRLKSAKKVCKYLGVKEFFFFNFPDNAMDTIPLLKIVKKLETIIKKIKPNIIYTHHYGDLNIDHKIVNQAVLTATRPEPGNTVKNIFSFEINSSTEWNFANRSIFNPTYFTDITGQIEKKKELLDIYIDEMRQKNHSRSKESIINLSKLRSKIVGLKHVESFEVLRYIET